MSCKFCLDDSGVLLENTCNCKGSMSFVHEECLTRAAEVVCSVCRYEYPVTWREYCRMHYSHVIRKVLATCCVAGVYVASMYIFLVLVDLAHALMILYTETDSAYVLLNFSSRLYFNLCGNTLSVVNAFTIERKDACSVVGEKIVRIGVRKIRNMFYC